jgi:hypothetical protein
MKNKNVVKYNKSIKMAYSKRCIEQKSNVGDIEKNYIHTYK